MTHFFETVYETVSISILWQMIRFVTIRLAVGTGMLLCVTGNNGGGHLQLPEAVFLALPPNALFQM
jgi:hypothetical protein